MKVSRFALAVAVMVATSAATASAQTATQTITYAVSAINQISVTGTASLSVTTATAGSAPTTATDLCTWAVTTNQTGAKVSASIASAMPSGLTLSTNFSAPAGGTSAGMMALGTVAVDLVTSITKLSASGLSITHQLTATAAAGVVTSSTKVVTYTISGGA